MDIYVTELDTGVFWALSMLPENAPSKGDALFQTYDIINIGEVKIPKGTGLLSFSWDAILPGKSRLNASYVKSQYWQEPVEIINMWERWRNSGTKLRLMITETHINHDVNLEGYSAIATGGNGDYNYSISFIQAKPMLIYDMSEINNSSAVNARPPAVVPKTYTVKSGDSLWKISQSVLGKGNRYMEIYNLNKDKIKSPNKIYVGQVLTLP